MGLDPLLLLVSFIGFFLALSVHEFAHALVAYQLGDRTAAHSGRLTLNPLAHIDLFGTIILPLLLILSNSGIVFGWAKPVPVNYFALKDQRWGPAKVSLAGPAANLIFGIICLVLYVVVFKFTSLAPTNLLIIFLPNLAFINFILMVFNLIPIPPLDGAQVLFALLPHRYDNVKMLLQQYGMVLLLLLLFMGVGFVFVIS
ncbi:site-2 protease family protein, partial [Patescibacteria group bacterium]